MNTPTVILYDYEDNRCCSGLFHVFLFRPPGLQCKYQVMTILILTLYVILTSSTELG